jgi:uncharacterized phage protein (TIGR02218 family)
VVGTWYTIEWGFFVSNTVGTNRVKLNGVEVSDLTLTDFDSQGTDEVGDPNPNDFNMTNLDGQYDDIYLLAGGSGVLSDDFISDPLHNPRIAVLRPNAAGTYNSWDSFTMTTNKWEDVDEIFTDEATTYLLSDDTSPVRQSWGQPDLPGGAVTAYYVSSVYRYASNGIQFQFGGPFIRLPSGVSGSDFDHTGAGEQWLGSPSWQYGIKVWDKSPNTSAQWTVAEVNDMETGIVRTSATGPGTSNMLTHYLTEVLFSTSSPPIDAFSSPTGVLAQKTHHLSSLFRITRTDGVRKFFTDHNAELVFADGETYKPVGGLEASARRREINLREPNLDVRGVVNSSDITVDDLRAGLYRNARIDEYLVDWRAPWAGNVEHFIYFIQETRFSGSYFTADLSGINHRLKHRIGRTYSRVCDYTLGDSRCKVQLFGLTKFGVSVQTLGDRQTFKADPSDVPSITDDYYNLGKIQWLVGANAGIISQVKDYQDSDRTITLELALPFDITLTDSFNLEPGCNKLFEGDCSSTKFDNQKNYGGFPYLPTTDRVKQGPSGFFT